MNLDLTSLEGAVAQLGGALQMHGSDLAEGNPELKKHLRGSVIQAFKFTYELSFKMIKRYLKMSSASPTTIEGMTFNEIIREASSSGLVRSDLQAWRRYRDSRGAASHTYNEEKAQEVFEGVPEFLLEARYVLARLRERGGSLG